MARLLAGAARADMTPPLGIPLMGFWGPRNATGIDTPLMAHALVLDDGAGKLVFVALDLIALEAKDVNEAKKQILARAGIAPERVLVSCSHTHEAPYPCPCLGIDVEPDPACMARVREAIVESVTRAAGTMAPADIGFGSTQVPGICQNRRRLKGPNDVFNVWMLPKGAHLKYPPAGPVDEQLVLLAVRRESGEPISLLWNFSLHAHAFASSRVCADYPYYVWQKVAGELGGDPTCVFLPGACGDINKIPDVPSQRVVDELAGALVLLYHEAGFSAEAPLRARLQPLEAPLRDFSAFQDEEIRRKMPGVIEACRAEWEILRKVKERSVRTSVHAMSVGKFAVAAVPGEYFCALGLNIKKRSPFALTAVAELTDDYVGYIPTSEAFEQGGYELFNLRTSKVARGVGERMADDLARLLAELHGAGGGKERKK